jgi:hypothetical protein
MGVRRLLAGAAILVAALLIWCIGAVTACLILNVYTNRPALEVDGLGLAGGGAVIAIGLMPLLLGIGMFHMIRGARRKDTA